MVALSWHLAFFGWLVVRMFFVPGYNASCSHSPEVLKKSPKSDLLTQKSLLLLRLLANPTSLYPYHFTISFLLFGRTKMSKFCMFAYKYMARLCSHPLCQQENSLVLCLAWIITKLFMIKCEDVTSQQFFHFLSLYLIHFRNWKYQICSLSLFFFLMLISNGNIAKQSAQYLCFVHLLPSLKINWLYSTLFSIFLHLDIIALCSHPKVTVIT